MTFDEVLDQIRALLQQRGRVTYGALKRRFALDEEEGTIENEYSLPSANHLAVSVTAPRLACSGSRPGAGGRYRYSPTS